MLRLCRRGSLDRCLARETLRAVVAPPFGRRDFKIFAPLPKARRHVGNVTVIILINVIATYPLRCRALLPSLVAARVGCQLYRPGDVIAKVTVNDNK